MTWIDVVPYRHATGRLRELYDRIRGPGGAIDNIMMAHSLRPHTMEGHMAIYKNTLHHRANTLPKWYLEAIGLYVSLLNDCGYCVEHHYEGMVTELGGDRGRAEALRRALEAGDPGGVLPAGEAAGLRYAAKLTTDGGRMTEADVEELRSHGYDDGEILEINQVASYFNYANRTVLGLGVDTEGDVLGMAPRGDDPDDWHHG